MSGFHRDPSVFCRNSGQIRLARNSATNKFIYLSRMEGFARDEVAWSPSENLGRLSSSHMVVLGFRRSIIYSSRLRGFHPSRAIGERFTIMHPVRGPVPGKWCRVPQMEDECGSNPMITNHTKPGRVLDHTPAAMLRRMGDGSARALKKVVSSCDMRRVGARSL